MNVQTFSTPRSSLRGGANGAEKGPSAESVSQEMIDMPRWQVVSEQQPVDGAEEDYELVGSLADDLECH